MRSPALATVCVLLAAAFAGLLFAPVFGVAAVLLPLGLVLLAMSGAALLCSYVDRLVAWRGLLVSVAGLVAVAEVLLAPTTVAGIPSGQTLRALALGVTESWQLTLQSTWPARPDPRLLLFVPLLVVLAGSLGVELLHRLRRPLLALLPGFAVALLSQLFVALPPFPAAVAALCYAGLAGGLLAATRGENPERGERRSPGRLARAALAITPAVALAVGCAVLLGTLLPAGAPAFTIKQQQGAPLNQASVTNPLNEIAARLGNPDVPVFHVRGDADVDRWRLAVLDTFDGANWTSDEAYRRMGTTLRPDPAVAVPVRQHSTRISTIDTGGPWLPSQPTPAGVRGVDPLIAEDQGTLLTQNTQGRPAGYTLTWWEPVLDGHGLDGAGIAPDAPGGLGGLGQVPKRVGRLADRAVRGLRPSFAAALVLERFLRENYRTATGTHLPTGHAWPQLEDFLLRSKRGTSEQFAAAYVALARVRGIPARLVVGFRAPAEHNGQYTVHNSDVLAWPEVAVEGAGWVPLDPGGASTAAGDGPGGGLAAAAAQARARLPAPEQMQDPPVAPPPPADSRAGSGSMLPVPLGVLLGVPVGLLLCWLVGVPVAKSVRCWRRRHKVGAPAVLGAWEEVRDRLRAHGVPVTPGMTVRDLATAAGRIADQTTVDGMFDLCRTVDRALWSGTEAGKWSGKVAWEAVQTVRKGLARRGIRCRVRAAVEPRSLFPPRR